MTLTSQVGYWRLVDDDFPLGSLPPRFYACPLSFGACLASNNGSCGVGYRGPTCGFCQPGYHLAESACVACQGGTKFMLPIVIVAGIACGALFLYIAKRFNTKKVVGVMQILIGYDRFCVCSFVVLVQFPAAMCGVCFLAEGGVSIFYLFSHLILAVTFKSWVRPTLHTTFHGLNL